MIKNDKNQIKRSLMFPLLVPKKIGFGAGFNNLNSIGHFINIAVPIVLTVLVLTGLYMALF